jgi:hypothetical protein
MLAVVRKQGMTPLSDALTPTLSQGEREKSLGGAHG